MTKNISKMIFRENAWAIFRVSQSWVIGFLTNRVASLEAGTRTSLAVPEYRHRARSEATSENVES